MTKEQRDFYTKNVDFVNDTREYYKIISEEFYYIINEVSGHTLKSESFHIGMIPFKPNINGILLDSENLMEFECDDIRAEIGSHLTPLKEMVDFEIQNRFYYEKEQLNIKKCEIYNESKMKYPFIRRQGGVGDSSGHALIRLAESRFASLVACA